MAFVARRVSSPLMVGRADAVATLESALAGAREGEAAVVLVRGEAGVGKTRLLREAARRADESGAQVLWGECLPIGNGELPYAALVGALRPLARSLDGADRDAVLGPARGELARLLPELAEGEARDAPTPGSTARLLELLLGMFERLGERAPVVLVVEDAHWADAATATLLAFLVRNLRTERMLLAVTWRDDEPTLRDALRGLFTELTRDDRVVEVALERLTPEETALQVGGIVGGDADAALATWAYRRGQGNPYFTEELVSTRAGGLDRVVPESLRALLLARMASASPGARSILGALAVAERGVDHAVLARATALDEPAVAAALHELLEAHVLVREHDGERYAFRHALGREALHADLLVPERRDLHARMARALESTAPVGVRGAGEWSALAHHWDAAGEPALALEAAITAGGAATAVYAFDDARRQLERARRLWEEVAPGDRPAEVDESELLSRLAEAARLAGHSEQALRIAEAARAALPMAAEPQRAARLELQLSVLIRDRDASVEHARRALELLPPGPSAERSSAVLRIASAAHYGALPSDVRRMGLDALEAAQEAGAAADVGAAHRIIGGSLAWGGETEAGLAHLRKAGRVALEHDRAEDHVRAMDHLGAALMMLGRLEEAIELYDRTRDYTRQVGLAISHGPWLDTNAAECEIRLGRWAQARARIARERAEPSEQADNRLAALAVALLLAAREGEGAATPAEEREALELVEANVSAGAAAVAFSSLAELALTRGDPAQAYATVWRAWERIRYGDLLNWPAMLNLGLRAAGDLAEQARAGGGGPDAAARDRAQELLRGVHFYGYEMPTVDRAPPETKAQWEIANAELTRIDPSRAPEPEPWSAIAARWDALRQPYQASYARMRDAHEHLATGDRPAAAAALRAAHATAVALGAHPLRGDIERLAKRARIALPSTDTPAAAEAPFDLTPRELTVLELVAAGRTNRQIAEELYLSTRTVDVHVHRILAKLDAANRVEAAGIAHQLGIGATT
jgi:DNA-binding CsgD family transcriptional regulator/tetratricopeptide (TPR) repeat protein